MDDRVMKNEFVPQARVLFYDGLWAAMPSRRQEKMSRIVKEAVSDVIQNHLSDPRIEGFISVTRVAMHADLRTAEVYISILGKDEPAQQRTFKALEHARSRIQSLIGRSIQSKFCPVLHLHQDEDLKKSLETLRIIDEIAESEQDEENEQEEES
jgi:ribosome-binding factor A